MRWQWGEWEILAGATVTGAPECGDEQARAGIAAVVDDLAF